MRLIVSISLAAWFQLVMLYLAIDWAESASQLSPLYPLMAMLLSAIAVLIALVINVRIVKATIRWPAALSCLTCIVQAVIVSVVLLSGVAVVS